MGTMTVSAMHPNAELRVSVPRAGRYSYHLSAAAVFLDNYAKPVEYVGIGEGYIDVKPEAQYEVEGDISGNTWFARLVER